MEGESSSGSKIEKKVSIIPNEYCLNILKGEANDHFFEGESPFKKARRFAQEVNCKILQNEANNDPQKTGGKMGHGTGVRTRLSTFLKSAQNM